MAKCSANDAVAVMRRDIALSDVRNVERLLDRLQDACLPRLYGSMVTGDQFDLLIVARALLRDVATRHQVAIDGSEAALRADCRKLIAALSLRT